ncbi:hypothetical protein HPB50_021596 [Hyalomma asiaticum]|uniref:Uncharacterized protein n=1 Tax=Hyalomma asiaticum TaxID=266040 RepID=A0ACB7TL87_HYAAI|nr:hypothetical protein HPB50_021596 [Hyalomma asiaticum]
MRLLTTDCLIQSRQDRTAHSEGDVYSSVEVSWLCRHHCADFEEFGRYRKNGTRSAEGSCLKTAAAESSGARSNKDEARHGCKQRTCGQRFGEGSRGEKVAAVEESLGVVNEATVSDHRDGTLLPRNNSAAVRLDELKLEIEALKLQLEVEKLKTARFLQNAAQARSEKSGLGRYAKDLKAVLVPMPADDTMVPAWFKMADSLLKMLEAPEEMQGTHILPFLTEKVRTSVVSQSLSGTCCYGELKEKVLKELKLTPTEYRRCFPEIKKEVREQSCDRTKLTGPFGKAITAEVVCVPIGLPCPSGNTRRVSLPVTRELTASADMVLTPGDHESHCIAMSLSEPKLEGTRDAVREEPNKGDEDDVCSEATLESAHESEDSRDNKIFKQEADPVSDGREQASVAKVDAAGDPAQVCGPMEKERPVPFSANAFTKERVHDKSSEEAHHAFDVVGKAVASMPTAAAPFSWSGKLIGHCPEEDGDQRRLSKGHAGERFCSRTRFVCDRVAKGDLWQVAFRHKGQD